MYDIFPAFVYEHGKGSIIVHSIYEHSLGIIITVEEEEEKDVIRFTLTKDEAGKLIEMLERLGVKKEEVPVKEKRLNELSKL